MRTGPDKKVADVSFDDASISVRLKDGRMISVPLAWYPRLFHATAEPRQNWTIAGGGQKMFHVEHHKVTLYALENKPQSRFF